MIGRVENAMLQRIADATANGALAYAYRSKETFPTNFDKFLSSETVGYPAVWSVFGGAHKIERVRRGRHRAFCSFSLVVAAQNHRNEQSRRHGGSAAEPGAYQLAQDALMLLSDQDFGLDIDVFTPTSIVLVETSDVPKVKELAIYAVSFDTALYFDALPNATPAEALAAFKTFHANWDPAPYGHVDADPETPGVQIPDDAHAIGTDNIALPQPEDQP